MPMSILACRRRAAAAAILLIIAAPALGQDDPSEQLEEFIHYTKIAKPELAASWAQKLLQSVTTDAQLAELLDENRTLHDRFEEAIGNSAV